EARAVLTRIGIDPERRIVALCPRTLIAGLWHPFSPQAIQDLVIEMADLTSRLLDGGAQVVLVQMSPDQPDDDAVVIDQIIARVDRSQDAPAVLAWDPQLPRLMISVFEQVDAVVAVRLHGAILAMLAGKPAMTIAYEPKVQGIMDAVGLGDHVMPVNGFDGRLCAEVVLDWLAKPDEIGKRVDGKIDRIRARAYDNLSEAVRLIAPEQSAEQRVGRWAG
ncbi:MAG: polysaccharide pyruvyl transferase family protein, partial [Pseudomonadota bacterium]